MTNNIQIVMYENITLCILKRSSLLIITGVIFLVVVTTLVGQLPPLIFPEIPFDLLERQVGEEFSAEEYMEMHNSIPYLHTVGKMISNLTGYSLLAVGIVIYVQDKRNGKSSYFSVKNKPVDMGKQTVFVFVPGLDVYAAYKIKKLTNYFLILLGIGIPIMILLLSTTGVSYYLLLVEVVLLPVAIYLIRKWSKKWNEDFWKQSRNSAVQ